MLTFATYAQAQSGDWLEDRATVYDETLTRWHIPYGQVWSVQFKTTGDYHLSGKCDCVEADAAESGLPYCGDVVASDDVLEKVYKYGGDGDGAIWTGTYLAMLAYRWAATNGDAEVEARMLEALTTVETLFGVTGQKGLLARSFAPPGANVALDDGNGLYTNDSGNYADYRWTGNISRDQYSGVLWGLFTVEQLAGDRVAGVRDRVTKLVTDFVDTLLENGYRMPREDGSHLSFKPLTPGQAIYLLAYVRYALQLTGSATYAETYSRLITRDSVVDWIPALTVARWHKYDFTLSPKCHFTGAADLEIGSWEIYDFEDSYYRFNILAPAIQMLVRLAAKGEELWTSDGGEKTKEVYREILDGFYWGNHNLFLRWSGMSVDHNALFDAYYAETAGDTEVAAKARAELELFPDGPRRKYAVFNPDIEEKKGCDNVSDTPLTVDLRAAEDFIWQRSPYRISDSCTQPWVEYPGLDFLLPYWILRKISP